MNVEVSTREGMMMERTSSIEKEPMTLHHDQLRLAREAALYVLSTRSTEEAWTIFTKGLKPVINTNIKNNIKNKVIDFDGDGDDGELQVIGASESTPSPTDVATAPF